MPDQGSPSSPSGGSSSDGSGDGTLASRRPDSGPALPKGGGGSGVGSPRPAAKSRFTPVFFKASTRFDHTRESYRLFAAQRSTPNDPPPPPGFAYVHTSALVAVDEVSSGGGACWQGAVEAHGMRRSRSNKLCLRLAFLQEQPFPAAAREPLPPAAAAPLHERSNVEARLRRLELEREQEQGAAATMREELERLRAENQALLTQSVLRGQEALQQQLAAQASQREREHTALLHQLEAQTALLRELSGHVQRLKLAAKTLGPDSVALASSCDSFCLN